MDGTEIMTIWDYIAWGFASGGVSYAIYMYAFRNESPKKNHVYEGGVKGFLLALTGILLAGLSGGLLAAALDHSRFVSVFSGMSAFFVFTGLLRGMKSGAFTKATIELAIKMLQNLTNMLTGGK